MCHLYFDIFLSLVLRFSYVLPPLAVLPLFLLSSLHCLRAIGKHCLPLFFFTIDFCMFCVSLIFFSYVIAKVMLGKVFVCFIRCLPRRCCCRLAPSYICISLGNFYLRFLDFHRDEIRRCII